MRVRFVNTKGFRGGNTKFKWQEKEERDLHIFQQVLPPQATTCRPNLGKSNEKPCSCKMHVTAYVLSLELRSWYNVVQGDCGHCCQRRVVTFSRLLMTCQYLLDNLTVRAKDGCNASVLSIRWEGRLVAWGSSHQPNGGVWCFISSVKDLWFATQPALSWFRKGEVVQGLVLLCLWSSFL